MMLQTDLEQLRTVANHAEHHQLVDTLRTVDADSRTEPTVWVDPDAFIRWARSIGAETIDLTDKRQACDGALVDGTPVRVLALRTMRVEALTIAVENHPEWGETR